MNDLNNDNYMEVIYSHYPCSINILQMNVMVICDGLTCRHKSI